MIKKILFTCLASVCIISILGMEQPPANYFSSLPKDAMEELPLVLKDIKKLIALNCDNIKDLKSFLVINKDNATLFKDPVILSYLLTIIFKIDDATRKDIQSLLETHKENEVVLSDPKVVGSLITRIAKARAQKKANKRVKITYLDGRSEELRRIGKHLKGFDLHSAFALKNENFEFSDYALKCAYHKIRIATRFGTESAATWLKEQGTKDKTVKTLLIQSLMRDYFLELVKESKVVNVKFLLKSGARSDAKDSKGATPLSLTQKIHAESPSIENTTIANILGTIKDADLNDSNDITIEDSGLGAPLEHAIAQRLRKFRLCIEQFKHKDAQALIEDGIDINDRDDLGNTPLMTAIWFRNARVAKMLIEKGADLTAVNNEGKTALDLARERKNKQIEDAILDKITKA
jgi:hypothetical protein